jgi:hypothetical protein
MRDTIDIIKLPYKLYGVRAKKPEEEKKEENFLD